MKLGTSNFVCWIHRSTSAGIIHYPRKDCDVSRDLLKFWETSDNISSTVQDRDIVAVEH